MRCVERLTDEESAKIAESKLIADLKLNHCRYRNGNGMNSTDGGDGSGGHTRSEEAKRKSAEAHMRPVSKYSKTSEFIRNYESLAEALRDLGKDPTRPVHILRALEGKKKSAYRFMWTDLNAPPPEPFKSERNKWRKLPVDQYDLEGLMINRYPSIDEAATDISGLTAHISSCCKGRRGQHKNFQWRYAGEPAPGVYERVSEKRQMIKQITLDGICIDIHQSQKLAAKAVGGSQASISLCVLKKMATFKGFIWERQDVAM